jgi:XTP/dITP diphosphohydrolase
MILYVATSNPGKLRDFSTAAANTPGITIEPLPNLAQIAPPPEDEPTFEGNARVKANAYSKHLPGQIILADDSGLEVDCLNYEPGVRSARYADDQHFPSTPGSSTDERNNAALLRAMNGIPPNCRRGRYRCVLAAARSNAGEPGEIIATASGTLEGLILTAPQGEAGFGYDPLFFIPELNLTMAQLDPITRLSLSHRGRALRNLLDVLLPKIETTQN